MDARHHNATTSSSDIAEMNFLQAVPLFAQFDRDELEALRKCFHPTEFGAGDVILEEGNANRALHVIQSGRVRVTRHVDGGDVILCDLNTGQTFGELSIIDDGVASATLSAVAVTVVMSISMNDLSSFLRDKPLAAAKFWRELAVELRRRLLQTNDVVRSYFELNRALSENPTFRQVYAMCNR